MSPSLPSLSSLPSLTDADVEFTKSTVIVEETAEVAKACVTVAARGGQTDCPVDHAFNVSFNTIDGSAGIQLCIYIAWISTLTIIDLFSCL